MNNAPINALVIRSDNIPDIIATKEFNCFEFYKKSNQVGNFGLLIVIPTTEVKDDFAVYGNATTGQLASIVSMNWPGRSGPYNYRVKMDNIHFTTKTRIKSGLFNGRLWSTSQTTFPVTVIESILAPTDKDRQTIKFTLLKYL
jgi:hypothetical protein